MLIKIPVEIENKAKLQGYLEHECFSKAFVIECVASKSIRYVLQQQQQQQQREHLYVVYF